MSKQYTIAVLAGLLSTSVAFAQQDGPNATDKPAEPTPQVQAVERAELATELAAYGRENGSAMALIVAAEIQAQVGARRTERESTSESLGSDSSGPETSKAEDSSDVSVEAWLGEARELAGSNAALNAAIERVASLESRGRVEGPLYHVGRAERRTRHWYTLNFRGGEPAVISVTGDGDTDIDLYVYDQNGNQICRDLGLTDRARCQWTPAWTGSFRVAVANLGYVWNRFVMLTN